MPRAFKTLFSALLILTPLFAAQTSSPEDQIASALQAAPAELRDGAAVLGYDEHGKLTTLRPGKNELICLASDPSRANFSVSCYHKDLEPYMARGRELTAQKITGQKRNEIRWQEVKDGKLTLPSQPRIYTC